MQKLSLGKGFTAQQNIKDDAMRPTLYLTGLVLAFVTFALIFCDNNIVRYTLLVLFVAVVIAAYYINIYFAHNDTDRLHTENYLINRQIVEAGLLEDKTISRIKQNQHELLTSDLVTADSEEVEDE